MMLKVGITGGIGSGKSIICNIFKTIGIPVFDADFIAKKIMNENKELKVKFIDRFGTVIYTNDGQLNRKMLAQIIFNNTNELNFVNSVVHSKVHENYQIWLNNHASEKYTIKEAAILFESNSDKNLDFVITVFCPEATRINRVMKRNSETEENVRKRINKQMSEDEKMKRANFIIYNNDNQLVLPQVLKLHEFFSSKTK